MSEQVKLSWMKWVPADWINDTRELSVEAKGCWIDLLCLMWNAPQRGVWKGTHQEFARATGLPWELAPTIINELGHKIATVTKRDLEVTIENRRMIKEYSHYKYRAKVQSEYRARHKRDQKVTHKTLDVRLKTTSTPTPSHPADDVVREAPRNGEKIPVWREDIGRPTASRTMIKPAPCQPQAEIVGLREVRFSELWQRYPNKHGRVAALKLFIASVKTDRAWEDIQTALDHYVASKEVAGGFAMKGSRWFGLWDEWVEGARVLEGPHG